MVELIIRNGFVLDGSGAPGLKQDIAIAAGKITAIGYPLSEKAEREIDATGLIVSPGFMDMHSHADRSILANPKAESAIRQGITFVLAGQCGGSEAPLTETARVKLQEKRETKVDWHTMNDFFHRLEQDGIAINLAMLIGQGTIRYQVMGMNPAKPNAEEMAAMCQMIDQAMQDGAYGLSTGRRYLPGSLASHEEIVEVTRPVAKYDGLYDSHIYNQDLQVLQSVADLIDVGRQSGARPHLAHQKVCGKRNWGKTAECLTLMEAARAEGIDILSDLYLHPYTQIYPIATQLPEWLMQNGLEAALQAIQAPETYQKVYEELSAFETSNPVRYQSVLGNGILWCRTTEGLEGLDLREVMARWQTSYAEMVLRLLLENKGQVKTAGIMGEEDIARILKHPYSMVGTDSFVVDDRKIDLLEAHPRNYETYPYTIAKYVREEKLIDLATCIHKMTGMVADRLRLSDRGRIAVGAWADVTVFDFNTIGTNCSITQPTEYPNGIAYVVVNGKLTWDKGIYHDVRGGKAIRNPKRFAK